ncbi:hypothetical protein SESBI_17073 [Sesbania bispinosa]|nr:hypothetical protein SESBI_17073 [Sesbania bispinosa]
MNTQGGRNHLVTSSEFLSRIKTVLGTLDVDNPNTSTQLMSDVCTIKATARRQVISEQSVYYSAIKDGTIPRRQTSRIHGDVLPVVQIKEMPSKHISHPLRLPTATMDFKGTVSGVKPASILSVAFCQRTQWVEPGDIETRSDRFRGQHSRCLD